MLLGSRIAVALAQATAPIRSLAWDPPHVEGVALEKAERKKKEGSKGENKLENLNI